MEELYVGGFNEVVVLEGEIMEKVWDVVGRVEIFILIFRYIVLRG